MSIINYKLSLSVGKSFIPYITIHIGADNPNLTVFEDCIQALKSIHSVISLAVGIQFML